MGLLKICTKGMVIVMEHNTFDSIQIGLASPEMIVAVVFIMTIKQFRPEYATVLTTVTCIVLFTCVIACLSPVTDMLGYITEEAASGKFSDFMPYIQIVMKSLGIALITQSTADICRDSGEGSIAEKIELAGKAEIFVLSLPLLTELIEITGSLLT